ncbi:Hydroxymethylglutaryl-CoA lyase, mitochondrial [Hordeum vulgare]|nr:Hydroxymethylglutaryl-CoA lyase, mitochondrial [Hordeum vulgare]
MKTGSDDATPKPTHVHAGFTMEQVHEHFNDAMVKEQFAPMSMSVFQQAHEEQQYNMILLEQHQLAQGQINSERASEEAMAAMGVANRNFLMEQRAIYEALRVQGVARWEVDTMEAQLQAIADENNVTFASYTPPTNYCAGQFDDDIIGATISDVGLAFIDNGQGADSSKDE